MNKREGKIILIDADVVSHFITGGEILALPTIFEHPLKILDKVYAELERFRAKRQEVDNLLQFKLLEKVPFPEEHNAIRREYFRLKNDLFLGEGESACLAVCRFYDHILASSNLRDIKRYCQTHGLTYYTTMDFLCEALSKGIFDEAQCNAFIAKVKAAGSKLPVNSMKAYTCRG